MFKLKKKLKFFDLPIVGSKVYIGSGQYEITLVEMNKGALEVYGREIPEGGQYMVGTALYLFNISAGLKELMKRAVVRFDPEVKKTNRRLC